MKYYPVFLDLRERSCVVVGGGQVAERKALTLFDAGADLSVISPSLTPALQELAAKGKIIHHNRLYREDDLRGAFLAVAATNDPAVNTSVARACRERNILVNVAAPSEESTFIVPSVIDRGDLVFAVSTGGSSPALARKIREELEALYGPEYERYLEKLALLRGRLRSEVGDELLRRKIYEAVVDSDVLYLLKAGKVHDADQRIQEIVASVSASPR